MITCISLNTAIDEVYSTSTLQQNDINRVTLKYRFAGGKTVNVAKVLQQLHVPVRIVGFIAGMTGTLIEQFVDTLHVEHTWVQVDGESRYCTTVVTKDGATELLEEGHTVTWQHVEQLTSECIKYAHDSTFFVLSGSLPKGMTIEQYEYVVTRLQQTNVRLVIDTSGETLLHAYKQQPFIMKPNEAEFATLTGKAPKTIEQYVEAMQQLSQKPPYFIVSLGKRGALFNVNDVIFHATAPAMASVNTVGSGDSFLAAFIAAIYTNQSIEAAAKRAMAAGRANAQVYDIAHVEETLFSEQLTHVQLTKFEG